MIQSVKLMKNRSGKWEATLKVDARAGIEEMTIAVLWSLLTLTEEGGFEKEIESMTRASVLERVQHYVMNNGVYFRYIVGYEEVCLLIVSKLKSLFKEFRQEGQ